MNKGIFREPPICVECKHQVPCRHFDKQGIAYLTPLTEMDPDMGEIFNRQTKGSALQALADLVTKLTYDEMLTLADSAGIEAGKLNTWAKQQLSTAVALQTGGKAK